ncbi:MAG: ATP-binding protein [Natronomonas sp.]
MSENHIQVFVAESKDQITELNNSLLKIEDDPSDDAAMDSIFRTAHTLKGNFGALGFEQASDLAHALEDLLDELRQGEREVTHEIMDIVFEAVDRIEAILEEIEREGQPSTDPTDEIARLRATLAGDGQANAETASDSGADGGSDHTFPVADSLPDLEGNSFVHARVEIPDNQMLGVDGMLVLQELTETFDEYETVPTRDEIESGSYPGEFDVFVPGTDLDTVERVLDNSGHVESVSVTKIDAEGDGTDSDSTANVDVGNESTTVAQDSTETNAESVESDGETVDTTPETDESTAESGGEESESIKSIRIDADHLDELYGMVEQLVTTRITIRRAIESGKLETASNSLNDLDKITTSLQDSVTEMRLIPLRQVVRSLPRVVRDTARDAGKSVNFDIYGEDVEIDRTILSKLDDPLIHILRNAVDHGIEPPEERESLGKPRDGTIELRANRDRDYVIIEVEDDGRGLDADDLRERAIEQDVISSTESDAMSDDEIYDLVFHPGFSTAEDVTEISGRGVGMDVVHRTVTQLDGTVDVSSNPGEGTIVSLRLPVSVAIVDVLFVQVGDREFGVPIKTIDEVSRTTDVERLHREDVVRHDDDIYPVIDLGEALDVDSGLVADGRGEDEGMLIRIRPSERAVALRCDAVNNQEEVVVKPMDGVLSGTDGLSGTAILGDGDIVPILDVVTL